MRLSFHQIAFDVTAEEENFRRSILPIIAKAGDAPRIFRPNQLLSVSWLIAMELHRDAARAALDDRTVVVNQVQFVERFAQSEFSHR